MAQSTKVVIELDEKQLAHLEKLKRVFGSENAAGVILASLEVADLLDTIDSKNYRLIAVKAAAPDLVVEIQRNPFKIKLTSTGK